MRQDSPDTLISDREKQIEGEIARHQQSIVELRAEKAELETAKRVLARLGLSATPGQSPIGRALEKAGHEHYEDQRDSPGKPEGIPTVPAMIRNVLKNALHVKGLEPKDITARIATLWWPDVKSEVVSSIAWRMWKRGDLEKEGSLYRLPQENKAADANSGRESSAALDSETALRPVEPVPGGGT